MSNIRVDLNKIPGYMKENITDDFDNCGIFY